MGAELKERDLGFVREDLPLREIDFLRDLSAIDSATLNKKGVELVQERVSRVLDDLGFTQRMHREEDRFAHLIVAERPGRIAGKFISLITHSDTVMPNHREFHLDLKDDRAYGAGVIDNKGGLVVGLAALMRFLKHFPQTEYGLRFICSPNEEMGSIGFTEIFRELGSDSVVAFGLEPALDNGAIIHQRRGNRWYDIEVTGREAHAGRSYGEHANAAHDLAKKLVDLSALTDYSRHISLSVGHIEGGKDRHNIVCGRARAKLDVRFASADTRDQLHRRIEKILAQPREVSVDGKYQTSTLFEIVDDCPPFSLTKHSRGMAREYAALVSQLEGRKIHSAPAGGAGDVNYLATRDNFVLDGLGPVGGEMHTGHEFVQVSTLKTRAQALAGFLHYLQSKKL